MWSPSAKKKFINYESHKLILPFVKNMVDFKQVAPCQSNNGKKIVVKPNKYLINFISFNTTNLLINSTNIYQEKKMAFGGH